ncbi:hypothetical protein SCH01S_48_01540 [Sphingomonas changbaiensis NBRC 104936]|uniref:Ice-binding protein C-terminal domain-containing protein n=1 Tax=Sphingomonas changbaiensis NBRC 104936 TaxID=1219043 RepID=A0A0E9MRV5_9SPHN|nr:hypothetical protein SCH01S_48_01540 [Sphingomonas changbaiensis NBRC 104936]
MLMRLILPVVAVLGMGAAAQAADVATGTASLASNVKGFGTPGQQEQASFFAYPGFAGGVRVALGDVTGDGVADYVTGAGVGGGPHVKVFDGVSLAEARSFFAYDPGFTGGVFVAAGDVNHDGIADIVTSSGAGAASGQVKVFDGAGGAEIRNFTPYPGFGGGARVAAGDLDGDGFADIVTGAGPGGGPHVKVFSGQTGAELRSFFAFAPQFAGGVSVAAGSWGGEQAIFVGAGPGGGPQVKVFRMADLSELASFFAFAPGFTGGVNVAWGDFDGSAALYVAEATNGDTVRVFDARAGAGLGTQIGAFQPYGPGFPGGIEVAAAPLKAPAVPEPASWALMIAGFGLAGAAFRTRRPGLHSAAL